MNLILSAVDFSAESDRALRRTMLLAQHHRAGVVLVHMVEETATVSLETRWRDAKSRLDALADTICQTDGVTCEARLGIGALAPGLIEIAQDVGADLVVMPIHKGQAVGSILAATTSGAIGLPSRPVLAAAGAPLGGYRRIMLATDLSEASAQAIERFQLLALDPNAVRVVMHGFQVPALSVMAHTMVSHGAVRAHIAEEDERATRALTAFMARLDLSKARAVTAAIEARAAQTVLACAKEQEADLIVIGVRERTLAGVFFGSTTAEILRNTGVDVLIVPPK